MPPPLNPEKPPNGGFLVRLIARLLLSRPLLRRLSDPLSRAALASIARQIGQSDPVWEAKGQGHPLPPPAPTIAERYSQALELARQAGGSRKALQVLNQCLKAVPDDISCLHAASLLQFVLKNLREAERLGRQAVSLAPQVP
ncbi:MAG TPA: hypothetical protein HPP80_09085, partial [Rhodospirillaceae bacterium]|nr:hypothetical protein [Rhodospirillaceae bacterium]